MSMETVRVCVGGGYDVCVGDGILDACGDLLPPEFQNRVCAVITDTNVAPLYLNRLTRAFNRAGITVRAYVAKAGERSKSMAELSSILDFLSAVPLTRADFLLSLGGGVAGDLAGFAAGCYMRGVRYVQMPTTLLSCVDASVGGKVGVNLGAGKNLAGLFYQPSRVLMDPSLLRTLTPLEYACGAAEAVKTGIVADEALFEIYARGEALARETEAILRCVRAKAKLVCEDERDTGARKALNLGHTYGHAIETLSRYRVAHGRAVAIGLAIAVRAAARMGDMAPADARRVLCALSANGLAGVSPFPAADLARAAQMDKKRAGDALSLIVPRGIGQCEIRRIPYEAFITYARAGLADL